MDQGKSGILFLSSPLKFEENANMSIADAEKGEKIIGKVKFLGF